MELRLRPYQQEVVNKNLEAMDRGVKSTLTPLFTGACKTVIFSYLASVIPGRTLIICPLRELVWQACEKVRKIVGDDVEIEMAEHAATSSSEWMLPSKVVVASKQTLLSGRKDSKRYQRFKDFQLVVVDEAHMQCSEAVIDMLKHFQSTGSMVAGFTATPFRMDGKPLMRSPA